MNRIALFIAFAAVSCSAMSVQESDADAYNLGKSFLNTLKDLTAESDYSAVQRKLSNENPQIRSALSNAFVKSANGETQLKMREVVRAFEEISKKNNLSPDAVQKAIANDPLYEQVAQQVAKANLYMEDEKVQRTPYVQ